MKNYALTVLRFLFYLGRVDKDSIRTKHLISCMPVGTTKKTRAAITELLRQGFIEKTANDEISIRRERRKDVCKLMNPESDPVIRSMKPIEDIIPKSFAKTPFLITQGSHKVKGIIDKYAFYKNETTSEIIVYLVSDNQKKSTIRLGALADKNSLYRRALLGIDSTFGTKVFTKAMMNKLGSSIVGNRQPTKALIDIMIFDGYLISNDTKYFIRTSKKVLPANGLTVEH